MTPKNKDEPLLSGDFNSFDLYPLYGDCDYANGDCSPHELERIVHRITGDCDFDCSLEVFARRNPDLAKRLSLYVIAPTSGEAISKPKMSPQPSTSTKNVIDDM